MDNDELDYLGKTRKQEAADSAAMLGLVMIAIAVAVVIGIVVIFLVF